MSAFAAPARAAADLERRRQASPKTICYRGRCATYTPDEQAIILEMIENGCPVRELELVNALKAQFGNERGAAVLREGP